MLVCPGWPPQQIMVGGGCSLLEPITITSWKIQVAEGGTKNHLYDGEANIFPDLAKACSASKDTTISFSGDRVGSKPVTVSPNEVLPMDVCAKFIWTSTIMALLVLI